MTPQQSMDFIKGVDDWTESYLRVYSKHASQPTSDYEFKKWKRECQEHMFNMIGSGINFVYNHGCPSSSSSMPVDGKDYFYNGIFIPLVFHVLRKKCVNHRRHIFDGQKDFLKEMIRLMLDSDEDSVWQKMRDGLRDGSFETSVWELSTSFKLDPSVSKMVERLTDYPGTSNDERNILYGLGASWFVHLLGSVFLRRWNTDSLPFDENLYKAQTPVLKDLSYESFVYVKKGARFACTLDALVQKHSITSVLQLGWYIGSLDNVLMPGILRNYKFVATWLLHNGAWRMKSSIGKAMDIITEGIAAYKASLYTRKLRLPFPPQRPKRSTADELLRPPKKQKMAEESGDVLPQVWSSNSGGSANGSKPEFEKDLMLTLATPPPPAGDYCHHTQFKVHPQQAFTSTDGKVVESLLISNLFERLMKEDMTGVFVELLTESSATTQHVRKFLGNVGSKTEAAPQVKFNFNPEEMASDSYHWSDETGNLTYVSAKLFWQQIVNGESFNLFEKDMEGHSDITCEIMMDSIAELMWGMF